MLIKGRLRVARIKLYGERNCGTKFCEKTLRLNLDSEWLSGIMPPRWKKLARKCKIDMLAANTYFKFTEKHNLGWKHTLVDANRIGASPDDLANTVFVTVTKNPYAWLLSMHKRPHHVRYKRKLQFQAFLEQFWPAIGRENAPAGFANAVEVWNQKNRSYLTLDKDYKVVHLTYEAFVGDPQSALQEVATKAGVALGQIKEVTHELRFKNADTSKDKAYFQDYYLNERWREKLSPENIRYINKHLDPELMAFYGYNMLQVD
jgi:hypothetical protein